MIQVLDNETINQIAAGEVIERPSAVVKELVENAIDAGATAITIEIKEGGISFIRITDNGSGIAKNEIKTAFLRHATSKIKTMEDLLTVHSLGFRGEALSSIAAVAQVELITRSGEEITGARYEIAGGEEKTMEEVGCPEGTTFLVRNLFYNTPARKKFLKTKTTESGYIQDLVLRYSLAHADIRFHFIVDGKTKLQTSGDGQVKTNIFYNYGPDVTRCLVPLEAEEGQMKLTGFIGKPELSRGNRTFMNYFVNGRYIKSSVITSAIEHAYKEFLMSHRYPFTALMLTIDSRYLDVNVHPTKMEVRFTNQEEVYNLFYQSIYDALKQITLIPEVSLEPERKKREGKTVPVSKTTEKAPEPFETAAQKKVPEPVEAAAEKKPPLYVRETPVWGKKESQSVPEEKEKTTDFTQMNLLKEELIQEEAPQFRMIGQVFDTYWLLEYQSELLIIDQHAAHEKVLYEKLMKRLKEKDGLTQNLAAPVVVTLSGREIEVLSENAEVFEKIGFRFEPFGDKEYLIHGVPADFLNVASRELFLEMLDGLMEEGKGQPELILERCASMACKAAVKGNNRLSFAEAETLFEQMLQMEQPYHCPHGRPTTIAMSRQEFEKKFKRIL
ncbi:MAG: DNA mismatch repair endonuclease MutL [Lachnospiraceae bacterium]|nr:DNA mismatch repair endonuclease MutL [Lachnospiraceae bacterium]